MVLMLKSAVNVRQFQCGWLLNISFVFPTCVKFLCQCNDYVSIGIKQFDFVILAIQKVLESNICTQYTY